MFAVYGRDVKATIEQPLEEEPMHPGRNTVAYEARLLKSLLLQLNWEVSFHEGNKRRVFLPESLTVYPILEKNTFTVWASQKPWTELTTFAMPFLNPEICSCRKLQEEKKNLVKKNIVCDNSFT